MNYELSQHAQDALTERAISLDWLERVLNTPEKTEPDQTDAQAVHHLGRIVEHGNRVMRVVINQQVNPVRVITVYFDRKMKGKL